MLRPDEILYKESKYFAQDLIISKKRSYFENKLKEYIGKPKELWKDLSGLSFSKHLP